MRVSVFGLGYVGAVSCGCFARDGMDVVGVDVNADKVRLINEGQTPIVERGLGEIISAAVQAGRLRATTDVEDAVLGTDVSVISVGTPSMPNGSLNVASVERVSRQIGDVLARKDARHLIVVRSTVLPGTVAKVVVPGLQQTSGKIIGRHVGICFNPEFLREGSSVDDHDHPPFTLIGCENDPDGQTAAALYRNVNAEVVFTDIATAEMVKYVTNAFHALKITFANEMGILAQALGVDGHVVMNLLCKDTKLNMSPQYLRPGFAFGGSCLPKDLRALLYAARGHDVDLPLTNAIVESNRTQVRRAIDLVVGLRQKRVSVLGISFKAGTDDLRESPLVELTEALIGKGFDIRIYDQSISLARLVGANKDYIEKEIPHISSLMVGSLAEAVDHGDVLIVGNASAEFQALPRLCRPGQTVVDLVRIHGLAECRHLTYHGIAW